MKSILIVLLISTSAVAQIANVTPSCCEQALSLTTQLRAVTKQRDSLITVGTRLLKAKDLRIDGLQDKGNARLNELATQLRQMDLRLALVKAELQNEIVRSRFLGFGRRAWAKQLYNRIK